MSSATFKDVINNVVGNVSIHKAKDVIIDASARSTTLVDELFASGFNNVIGYGNNQKHEYIHSCDYMSLNLSRLDDVLKGKRVHFVCIPPFDAHIVRTLNYIKKYALFAHSFAFIVPASYKKDIYKTLFPATFKKVFEKDYPSDAFVLNGKYNNAPHILQIWVKTN